MSPRRYPTSNRGRTWLNGRLRLDRGGAAVALPISMAAPWLTLPEFRFGHYGAWRLGFSSSKRSRRQGDPYPGSLMVGWAPRWLMEVASFIHLLSSVHGFSNGPPVKVSEPTGAVASPWARRGLQLWRAAVEIGARQRWLSLGPKSARYRALFIGVFIPNHRRQKS
jgi:hypothetical protein